MKSILLFFILVSAFVSAQDAKDYYKIAKKLVESNNCEQALVELDKALAIDANFKDALESRATCYEKLGKKLEAAQDYGKLSDLDISELDYHSKTANLYVELGDYAKAAKYFVKITDVNKKTIDLLFAKIQNHSRLGQFEKAMVDCEKILNFKRIAKGFLVRAQIADSLKDYGMSERDLMTAIELDPTIQDAHYSLAGTRFKQKKYNEAIEACNQSIQLYARHMPSYYLKAKINYIQNNNSQAIADLTYGLSIEPFNIEFLMFRAQVFETEKQVSKAISDYSKVIGYDNNNLMAFYYRAKNFELVQKNDSAIHDYEKVINLFGEQSLKDPIYKYSSARLYELNRETDKPAFVLQHPKLSEGKYLKIAGTLDTIEVKGYIKERSKLKFLKFNNISFATSPTDSGYVFSGKLVLDSAKQVIINTADVYDNTYKGVFMVERTEITPPAMSLLSPYSSDSYELYLQSNDEKLFIEGRIQDESFIKSVIIEGVTASFSVSEKNPSFTATIPISGKDSIQVMVADEHNNKMVRVFKLNREAANIAQTNPMGKTWVVFIENSKYQFFASLEGPQKDVTLIRSALSNYQIHNIVHKRDMGKAQLEKFFAIELRDMVKQNNISSLLIWYAGHGKYINETGYWIPVDAQRDDEFSYFNINNLKSALLSYSSQIVHTLVITDACESGPSFYQAMRAATDERACDDYQATKFKSSQVFSSAGYELASDNSQFSKTFANALRNNPNPCIPIEKIVNQVKSAVKNSGAAQEPKFGKIAGLTDENGTFFFMAK